MNNALPRLSDVEQSNTEMSRFPPHRGDTFHTHWKSIGSSRRRRDRVVRRGERQFWIADREPGILESDQHLCAAIMDQMPVYMQQMEVVSEIFNDVVVPDFAEQCLAQVVSPRAPGIRERSRDAFDSSTK